MPGDPSETGPEPRGGQVGFIGLGAMGEGMSLHLVRAGYRVRGWDVDPGALARFRAGGGEPADSAPEAARDALALFVCVFDARQARQVLEGEGTGPGAFDALAPGAVIVLHTTVSPEEARALEAGANARGFQLLDAPVTGGKQGADEGTLTVIASGTEAAFGPVRRMLEAMSGRIFRVGERAGAAATVKMVNQLLVGVHVAAAAEAIALAAKAGADPSTVYEIINSGAARSLAFETRIPNILAGDFTPRGVVDIFTKDLGIVMEASRALSMPVPLAAGALQQFLAAAAAGLGRADDGAVIRVYEALGNVRVAGTVPREQGARAPSSGGAPDAGSAPTGASSGSETEKERSG